MTVPLIPPPQWATDELSRFQDVAFRNEWASFVSLPELWQLFQATDEVFHRFAEARIARIGRETKRDPTGALLLCNAHVQFRATLRLCTSGHVLPVFSTGRSALESTLYGWYLVNNPDAIPRWRNKPEDGPERRKWGQEFAFRPINRELQKVSPDTAIRAMQLHEHAIEFGSHPNSEALSMNVGIREDSAGKWFELKYLHGWGGPFATAARFTSSIGLIALEIIQMTEPDSDEVAEVARAFPALSKRLLMLQIGWEARFCGAPPAPEGA